MLFQTSASKNKENGMRPIESLFVSKHDTFFCDTQLECLNKHVQFEGLYYTQSMIYDWHKVLFVFTIVSRDIP